MRITRMTLWEVPLTSHETYFMAAGKSCATISTLVLRIETDQSIDGWGEVCPIPHYLPAYANGVAPALKEMSSVLIGADPVGPEAVLCRMHRCLQGHAYTKSIVDMALWDITAKVAGLPLYKLLGGKHTETLPLYHSITCVEPETMAAIAVNAEQQGINQFQVKLGVDGNWETDVARLSLVRQAVNSRALVYGDWNCGASQLEATRVARAVADLDIMLEQPCATLEECAQVKRASGLPMKIDESAHDIPSLLYAYKLGCMDAVALKLSKFGGLSEMRKARDLCVQLGVKMCVEDTWGSDITTATAIHLGTATTTDSVLNVCDLSGYVYPRLYPAGPARKCGTIAVTVAPGHGVVPDLQLLGEPILIQE